MGRPKGSKNRMKFSNLQDPTENQNVAGDNLTPESFTPRPRKNRKNKQTAEGRLLSASNQLSEVADILKGLAEELRDNQDSLIKKVREVILNQ